MTADAGPIQLETYQCGLLRRTRQYHDFADDERERIFREHLAYTLGMVARGDQLAAGPVPDGPAGDEVICGIGLYQKDTVADVRQLLEQDPGVRQGLYTFDVMTWQTPKGSLAFPLSVPAQPSR